MKRTRVACLLLAGALALAGCGTGKDADPTIGWSADKLYSEAKDEMASGNYAEAVKLLEKLESRYPFGRWSQQAQIDIAYAQFKDNERALALAATDRFLKLHPNHPALDYVYYLRGLINFNEQQGLLANLGGQDLAERDLKAAREAFDSFRTVVTRYPESKYAPDSADRMRYLVNSMASGEVYIARFYFRRGAYIAAANRAQSVVRQYQQTPAVEEALGIMIASYRKLGLDDLADGARRVLTQNYPGSRYLEEGAIAVSGPRWWQFWR